jgi:hypothetical protein
MYMSSRLRDIGLLVLAIGAVCGCHSPTPPSSSGITGGEFNIGTGFGGPIQFASFALNPQLPDPLQVGQSVLITLTPTGADAQPGYEVQWFSAGHEFATWRFPETRCAQNNCAILTPVAATAEDPASPTYTVLLTMAVCPSGKTAFCPSRGFYRRVIK